MYTRDRFGKKEIAIKMLRYALILIFALFSIVSCQAGAEKPGENKGKSTMEQRYYQPFGNEALNSFQPVEITAKGNLAWKFTFNDIDFPGSASNVHLIDDDRAIIDCGGIFFAVDLNKKTVVTPKEKSSNTFIRLGEDQNLYYFSGFRLNKNEFYNLLKPEDVETEGDAAADEVKEENPPPQQADSYVPWLGEHSELLCFIPKKESFVTGVLHSGNPLDQKVSLVFTECRYDDYEPLWEKKYDFPGVMPPVNSDGRIFVCLPNAIQIVDIEGRTMDRIKTAGEPVFCSLGPDGTIYIVAETDEDRILSAYDSFGERHWEVSDIADEVYQPPLVTTDGLVCVLGENGLTAIRAGEQKWIYPVSSENARATIGKDGMIILADGLRVVCIDTEGTEVWTYIDEDGDEFTSPPVIDSKGHIVVGASDKIVKID